MHRTGWLLAALLTTSTAAHASELAAWAKGCNDCSESQYASLADALALKAGRADGQILVYDLANENLRAFDVEREPNGAGGFEYRTSPKPPGAAQLEAFHVQAAAIRQNGGTSAFVAEANSGMQGFPVPHATGIEFARAGYYRNDVSDWLASDRFASVAQVKNISQPLAELVAAARKILLIDDVPSFTTTVKLDDGAKAIYTHQINAPVASLVSLQDRNGNTIPMKASEAAPNRYHFPQGGGEAMAGFLHEQFGFEIRGGACKQGVLACPVGGSARSCTWTDCSDES